MIKKVICLGLLVVLLITTWIWLPNASKVGQDDGSVALLNKRSPDKRWPYKSTFFSYKDQYLRVVEGGNPSGEPILFLHGFPSFWYSLSRQMEALASSHRLIAVDGLGAGLSDAPNDLEPYLLENLSAHLIALMDAHELEKFHLVGHDWGSSLALGMAQKHPDRVLTVTGISGPPTNVLLPLVSRDSASAQKYQYVEQFKRANPILLKVLFVPKRIFEGAYQPLLDKGLLSNQEAQLFRQANSDTKRINAHLNWYRANLPARESISDQYLWPHIKPYFDMPTLVILGKEDQTFARRYLDIIAKAGENVKVLEIDGAGHWPHIEFSAIVNRAIINNIAQAQP